MITKNTNHTNSHLNAIPAALQNSHVTAKLTPKLIAKHKAMIRIKMIPKHPNFFIVKPFLMQKVCRTTDCPTQEK
jgi:hypothetical protein